jgi:uncharacterized protein YjbI with pentapeptide repeats
MADLKHLQVLSAGRSIWNEWRQENSGVTPDLDAANLHGFDLRGTNLVRAKLSEADLSNATLAGARLAFADLWRATLDHADLTDADLQNANARAASFRAATFVRTNLCLANLESADLRGANLHEAELGRTTLVDADLTDAKQLETCRFWAPVGIDSRTLIRSAHLPAPFLRGCGVPEEVLENLPALFRKTIEYYSILIRCAAEDMPLVERLDGDLMARGIRCWRVKPMPAQTPATGLGVRLEDSFRQSETRLLLVLSRHTIRARAPWLEHEAKLCMQNERVHNRKLLFPVRADDARLGLNDSTTEQELNQRAVDFRRWKERKSYFDAVNKLIVGLSS